MAKKEINKEIKIEEEIITPIDETPNLGQETVRVTGISVNLANPTPKVRGLRINVGSGVDYKADFLNVDKYDPTADANWDVANLPLRDHSVAQIICYSTLEHFPKADIIPTLKEWYRVLKVEGTVHLTVPDIVDACKRVIEDPEDDWQLARLYGHQANEGQFHKTGFTPKRLFQYFALAGFRGIGIAYFEEKNKVKHMYVEASK